MKKIFLFLLTFCALSASAQNEIIVGDMDDDGQLTVGDVTALTETVVGRTPIRTISTKCDPNISDPAAIAGEWRAVNRASLSLGADGKAKCTEWPSITHFEYYPYARLLVLLNEQNDVERHFTVLRLSANRLDLDYNQHTSYYPNDDMFATNFVISPKNLTLKPGATQQLSIIATPEGTLSPSFVWESKNRDIATIGVTTGILTAVKTGTATIIAHGGWGIEVECTVEVVQPVESIILNYSEVTLDLDETIKLAANVLPEDACDRTFIWSSSNPDVATVLNNGMVIAMSYGTATITATANDGSGVKAECVVIVSCDKNSEYWGYVDGTKDQITTSWCPVDTAPHYFGISMPGSSLSKYKGGKIIGLRCFFGQNRWYTFTGDDIVSKVFLLDFDGTSPGEKVLATSKSFSPTTYNDFDDYFFETPYTITDSGVFCSVELTTPHQGGMYGAMGACQDVYSPGACWMKNENKWEDLYPIYGSSAAALAILAIIVEDDK